MSHCTSHLIICWKKTYPGATQQTVKVLGMNPLCWQSISNIWVRCTENSQCRVSCCWVIIIISGQVIIWSSSQKYSKCTSQGTHSSPLCCWNKGVFYYFKVYAICLIMLHTKRCYDWNPPQWKKMNNMFRLVSSLEYHVTTSKWSYE